jgi:hypothetical protein
VASVIGNGSLNGRSPANARVLGSGGVVVGTGMYGSPIWFAHFERSTTTRLWTAVTQISQKTCLFLCVDLHNGLYQLLKQLDHFHS